MKYYKHTIIAIFAISILGTPWLVSTYPKSKDFIDAIFSYANNNFVAVFLRQSITVGQLKDKYVTAPKGQEKVRILLVPGHEPDFGGTEFADLKEREMNVELSRYLEGFFKNNSHYEVFVARDNTAWNSELQNYFNNHWSEIAGFVKNSKSEMLRLVNTNEVKKIKDAVTHNKAPKNIALRLYGINKWANENRIDMVIHIHFNDYPRHNIKIAGEYSGFSIYVPEKQFSNSTTTRAIADSVFKKLSKYNAVSNLPNEEGGVIEDQELIAIGSYNTLDAPSMLIEYGYIYEQQFIDDSVRGTTLKDLAFQTYLGVQDFFGAGNDVSLAYDTLMLPYDWRNDITKDSNDRLAILALQSALTLERMYPPENKTKNDCPRTGRFGPCTINALSHFQRQYSIANEENKVGDQTKRILNGKYSLQLK